MVVKDVERALRRLGERASADIGRTSLSNAALRRIRIRRAVVAGATVVSLVAVGIAGSFGVAALRDDSGLPPVHTSPTPTPGIVDNGCNLVSFVPTYLPEGINSQPKVVPGDGTGSAPFAVYEGPQGVGIDLARGTGGYAQTDVRSIAVLGAPATLGNIHEGYSVQFFDGLCELAFLGYGIEREELRRFAENLLPIPEGGGINLREFGALWPEDTVRDTNSACARETTGNARTSPTTVALEFASGVLDWQDAIARPTGQTEGSIELHKSASNDGAATGDVLDIDARQFFRGCWSIVRISRTPTQRPTDVSVEVSGRDVRVRFDPRRAASVRVDIGYGRHEVSRIWNRGIDSAPLVVFHRRFLPTTTGHFLILLSDAAGEVFSATGGPLPAGDFVGD